MWTDRSLSQASDHWSAQYKAKLFPSHEPVIDACCGAGADLVSLAKRGEVMGIDSDPQMTHLAEDNARAHGYRVKVCTELLSSTWQGEADWLSIDPDRRATGKRTTDADEFGPTLDDVLTIAQRMRGAIIKLAPSTRISDELLSKVDALSQRVWLGNQGECRQQLLLTGELMRSPSRRAVLCEPATMVRRPGIVSSHLHLIPDQAHDSNPIEFEAAANQFNSISCVDVPLRYLFDLHNVLHAAELQSAWAHENNICCLSDDHGYYTSDAPLDSPWAQAFEVLAVLPWDDRQLRKWLRNHCVGTVEVKTRALQDHSISIDANACQRRYSSSEGEPLTLLATRVEGRIRGVIARRVPLAESTNR